MTEETGTILKSPNGDVREKKKIQHRYQKEKKRTQERYWGT